MEKRKWYSQNFETHLAKRAFPQVPSLATVFYAESVYLSNNRGIITARRLHKLRKSFLVEVNCRPQASNITAIAPYQVPQSTSFGTHSISKCPPVTAFTPYNITIPSPSLSYPIVLLTAYPIAHVHRHLQIPKARFDGVLRGWGGFNNLSRGRRNGKGCLIQRFLENGEVKLQGEQI